MLDKTAALLEAMEGAKVFRMKKEGKVFTGDIGSEVDPAVYGLWVAADREVKLLRALPEIVMLAGSSRFKQAFETIAEQLALDGRVVLGKHVFKPGAEWPIDEAHKDLIHAVQFRMCDLASRLHIVNVDGYVGQDTYNLIRYAVRTDRLVTFHEDGVCLLDREGKVTAHHFLQATIQRVKFEEAAFGS
jgi:hypothetical protein